MRSILITRHRSPAAIASTCQVSARISQSSKGPRALRRRAVRQLSFFVATLLLLTDVLSAQASTAQSRQRQPTSARALPALNRSTPELVILAFTSSACGWAQRDSFKLELDRLTSVAREYARTQAVPLTVVRSAAALDNDPELGLQAIRRLGEFDEISIGRGWLNSHAIAYSWRDEPGRIGSPSVLLISRVVTPRQQSIAISADSVVDRGLGVKGITEMIARLRGRTGPFVSSTSPAGVPTKVGAR
jgi:hypothetical protein